MKKICFLLVMLLITSGFSGCIGQEQPAEDNNTSTASLIIARTGILVSGQCCSGQVSGTGM